MFNSSVFRFFKKITQNNGIIILPTSKEQNVQNLADEILIDTGVDKKQKLQ